MPCVCGGTLASEKPTRARNRRDEGHRVPKDHRDHDAHDHIDDLAEALEPAAAPRPSGQALQQALHYRRSRQHDVTAASDVPGAVGVLEAPHVQVENLAGVVVGAVGPELAAVALVPAEAAPTRRLLAKLEGLAVLDEAHRQLRAAGVEVEVTLAAVVHEAVDVVAARIAAPAAGGGWRLVVEGERAFLEESVLDGGRREGAADVEVEVAWLAPVPVRVAGLHAAVASERIAGGGHQLELVRRVGRVGDNRGLILEDLSHG